MSGTTLRAALVVVWLCIGTTAHPDSPPPSKPPARPPLSEDVKAALKMSSWLEKVTGKEKAPETVRLLAAIDRGVIPGNGDGWFGPPQMRYTWEWLAKKHDIAPGAGIPKDKFQGSAAHFARFDRNKDGRITGDDLDWSDRSAWVQQSQMATRFFRRMDPQGDGRLTRDDLLAFFEKAAGGKDHLTADDLRDALLAGAGGMFAAGDAPNLDTFVRGVFRGEVGSLYEGPRLDQRAPDFKLKTHDGKKTIRLSEAGGGKPVVLVFGNFTCPPFRASFPTVDELSRRYKDEAVFLGVYVREAHPEDGWRMATNAKVGVEVKQPTTYAERVEVAGQCQQKLKYSMPLLVDEIDDRVGHAYSGMPARLYVIDKAGKVAYKGARGPFGFRPGEMEQALLMLRLDQQASASKR